MADTSIFTPQSQFAAPETAAQSTFDVSQVDRNIRQLNQVQQTWRLPALPETVKLDFASMDGANEDSLLELMLGFDSDFEDEDEQPEPSGLMLPRDLQPSGMEQVQIILAGASGNKPPTNLSEDAVRLWKRRAIQDGYLDMDESRIDSSWSPELNRVRGEMGYDDWNRSLRQPMLGLGITDDRKVDGGVMGLLNDFTSPSGLLSAATELDLFWDFGAINNEISSWGDKWREVGKSDNPWDFAGNLIDAITGPIDDIVFPILNVGLMFTGVGAIANSARVGWQGTRLLEATSLFGRLYNNGGSVGRMLLGGARWGANLDEIGRASWMAGRLQRGGDIASGLGRGLEAWRAWTPTKVAKTITQQGMRMGFAQELENRVPGYASDGASFADIGPVRDAAGFLERAKMSPAAMPFELLLAPYNIFTPGSLTGKTGLLSRVGRTTYKGLGTAGGRAAAGALLGATGGVIAGEDAGDIAIGAGVGAAAGAAAPLLGRGLQTPGVSSAIKGAAVGAVAGAWLGDDPEDMALGALAGVGLFTVTDTVRDRMFAQMGPRLWDRAVRGVGGTLERTNFAPLADNQRVSLAFDQGMQYRLRNEPERLQQWKDNVTKGGVRFALAAEQGGDPNLAAATIGFVYVSAAIDWIATAQAGVAKGSKGWRQPYNAARNKLINQLRRFDVEGGLSDGMLEDLASAMAWTERGSSPAAAYKRRAQILSELRSDPERALELANGHNIRATETLRQLFEPTNFPTIAADELPESTRFSELGVSLSLEESFANRSLEARGWDLAKYMDGMMDSFGRFPEFAGATDSIRQARLAGLLDGAKLKAFKTRFGTERSVYRVAELEDTEKAAVNSAITDRLLRVDKAKIGNLKATPLAPAHSPASFTVALRDTKTKQDLEELAEQVRDIRDAHDHIARLTNPGEWRRQAAAILGTDEAAKLNSLTAEQIKAVIAAMPKELGSKKGTGYLIGYAKRHDLSLGELELALQTHADDLAKDEELWLSYGLGKFAENAEGRGMYGLDALSARLNELQERIPYTASAIDTDELIRYYDELAAPSPLAGRRVADFTALVDGTQRDKALSMVRALKDDDLIVVYHRTTPDRAARLASEGRVDTALHKTGHAGPENISNPGDLYVSGSFGAGRMYGDTAVAITVRKGDLQVSPESISTWSLDPKAADPAAGLFLPDGSVVRAGAEFLDVRVVDGPRGSHDFAPMGKGSSDAAAKAQQVRELVEGLDRDGYQLVHGTEFLMPEDLAHGPIFEDVTRRHLNAATFGNFFKGKLPAEAHILEDRRQRLAISNALAKINNDLHPDDKKVGDIIRALNEFLEHKRQPLQAMLRDYPEANFSQRVAARYASSVAPIRVDDLSRHGKELRPWLEAKAGLTAKEAEAVWLATHKFRATAFNEVGLYGLEAKLRNTNVLEWGLKTLTGSRYADDWKGKLGGFGAAAGVGATYGAVQTVGQEDLSFEDRLAAAVTGAAGGAIGLGAARVGTNVLDQAARLAPGAHKGMKLADRAAHWQYGYLFDHLAQLRDSLRFSLSPMFDLSRYTEGLFLAQTAAPLRNPKTGERFQLPFDMSPHGLRRALRKEGMTPGQAQAKYREWESTFQNFAKMRGDFDAEVLDSTGKWFKQLGMLGFSPTDWMSTAYAHMVRAGLSEEQAYEAARQMYTYGTRGRSAAELSTNFIFFPFSFQKKALGHLAKWMKDDLGRSIIIHDALRTYQILDEKYDLDQRWKDHVPFIQQLQRLNLFAFGLSPGRLGGINSQMFESAGKLAWNMFVPVGLDIKNVSAGEEIKDVMHQLTPLLNDIEWMTKNIQETENVLFSPTHVTRSAEIRDGYSEWYDFKKGFEAELERKGYTLDDVMNKPWLAEAKAFYDAKKAELADKFPAWFEFKTEKAGEIVALQMERQLRLDRVKSDMIAGRQPSPDDLMVAQFEEMLDRLRADMRLLTGSSDLSDAPSRVTDEILRVAVEYARQNPRWIQLYEQWYGKEFGPLSVVLEMVQ